jgi:hypothetical protein
LTVGALPGTFAATPPLFDREVDDERWDEQREGHESKLVPGKQVRHRTQHAERKFDGRSHLSTLLL